MENKVDWKDVAIRAIKTFLQTALSYLLAALGGVDFGTSLGKTFWIGLGLSAGAAGLSAVWNGVLTPIIAVPGVPEVQELLGQKKAESGGAAEKDTVVNHPARAESKEET